MKLKQAVHEALSNTEIPRDAYPDNLYYLVDTEIRHKVSLGFRRTWAMSTFHPASSPIVKLCVL